MKNRCTMPGWCERCNQQYCNQGNDETPSSTDLLNLLKSGLYSDIVLVIAGAEFTAHKEVLSQRSLFFKAMWSSEVIHEIEVDVFRMLLACIYAGKVSCGGSSAKSVEPFDLLMAITRFGVSINTLSLERAVEKKLDAATVLRVLDRAKVAKYEHVVAACRSFIMRNHHAVVKQRAKGVIFDVDDLEELVCALERAMPYTLESSNDRVTMKIVGNGHGVVAYSRPSW